jgi:hypothetical protein
MESQIKCVRGGGNEKENEVDYEMLEALEWSAEDTICIRMLDLVK